MLQPLIEYLAADRDGKTSFIDPEFQALLEQMINAVFGEKIHQRTADSSLIEVKRSDRWAYASLCWRKMVFVHSSFYNILHSKKLKAESNKEKLIFFFFQNNENEKEDSESEDRRHAQLKEVDLFSKALLTLLNIGGPKIHCRLIVQCTKLFRELVGTIRTEGLEVIF